MSAPQRVSRMPVPEPSTAGGLWAVVKPVTGWPETDEDRLALLAEFWRSGAHRFTTPAAST